VEISVTTADQTGRPPGTTGRFRSVDTIHPVIPVGTTLPNRWKCVGRVSPAFLKHASWREFKRFYR
jgi:hypothetical protein